MFNRSRFFTTLLSNSWEELTLPGAACFPIHKKILKINPFLQTNKKSTYKMSQSYVFADGQVYKAIGSDRIMFATDLWYRWHWLLIASQIRFLTFTFSEATESWEPLLRSLLTTTPNLSKLLSQLGTNWQLQIGGENWFTNCLKDRKPLFSGSWVLRRTCATRRTAGNIFQSSLLPMFYLMYHDLFSQCNLYSNDLVSNVCDSLFFVSL